MRGAPQRRFSAAKRRISDRSCGSMHGLPGRRARRRQDPRNPSRSQRATVAGRTSSSAFRHRGHHRRQHSQSRRSEARKRRSERARTPSWWCRARFSSSRSLRVNTAERSAATARKASRIACRMASRCANVNEILLGRDIGEGQEWGSAMPVAQRWDSRRPDAAAGAECERLGRALRALNQARVSRSHHSARRAALSTIRGGICGPLSSRTESSRAAEPADRARPVSQRGPDLPAWRIAELLRARRMIRAHADGNRFG